MTASMAASAAIEIWTYWPNSRTRMGTLVYRIGRRRTLQEGVKNFPHAAVKALTIALNFAPRAGLSVRQHPTMTADFQARTRQFRAALGSFATGVTIVTTRSA